MSRQTISPYEIMLAASTVPLIVGLLALKSFSDALTGLGQASEEIFRGDRLPVLHLHTSTPINDNSTLD